MSMLARADVVGRTIRDVLRSDFEWTQNGIGWCKVYVLLDSGVAFELAPLNPGVECAMAAVDLRSKGVIAVAFPKTVADCRGERIVEAIRPEPCVGLLLSSNRVLLVSDAWTPETLGPCLLPVHELDPVDDLTPLW